MSRSCLASAASELGDPIKTSQVRVCGFEIEGGSASRGGDRLGLGGADLEQNRGTTWKPGEGVQQAL